MRAGDHEEPGSGHGGHHNPAHAAGRRHRQHPDAHRRLRRRRARARLAARDRSARPPPTSWRRRCRSLLALDGLGFGAIDAAIVSTVVPQLGPEYRRLCERHTKGPLPEGGPEPEDRHADPGRQPARARRRPPRQRGRGPRPGRGRLRHRGLRHLDELRRRLARRASTWGASSAPASRSRSRRSPTAPRSSRASTWPSPGSAIGRNTVAAIQSGFAYGFAGLVDGIATRLCEGARRAPRGHRDRRPGAHDRPALRDDRRGRPAADPARPAPDPRAER